MPTFLYSIALLLVLVLGYLAGASYGLPNNSVALRNSMNDSQVVLESIDTVPQDNSPQRIPVLSESEYTTII